MSLIHKALQLGDLESGSAAKVAVSPETIQREKELTTPSSKWMEMYQELDQEARGVRPQPKPAVRRRKSGFDFNRQVTLAAIVAAVLILAGGFTAFNFFHIQPLNSSSRVEMAAPQPATAAAFQGNVNPIMPEVSLASNLVLSGIIEGKERMALINNRAVGAGDYVGNALVKEIQGRRVILEVDGKEVFLVL